MPPVKDLKKEVRVVNLVRNTVELLSSWKLLNNSINYFTKDRLEDIFFLSLSGGGYLRYCFLTSFGPGMSNLVI